jgi:membrane fusion protein (multidrug efflux system)
MKKLVVLAMLTAVLTGCGSEKQEGPKAEKGTRVKTTVVRSVQDDLRLRYSGTVEASQVIPLSFKTVGTVDKIYVEVGDVVTKGQLLASLDDSDLQNICSTMQAKYNQAEDAYNRLKQVHDEGSLPEIKWEEMKSNYEQAKSALDLAKNNLDKCRMISPVDGIVGRRNIEPGQSSISLAQAPIELVKIETVLVKISVPENEINKISDGQKAGITVAALDGQTYEGTITNISPMAEMMSRTYTAKITVTNTGRDLKPGMVCDVSLNMPSGGSRLIVPNKSVSKDSAGNTYVFIVASDNNTVKKQIITIGRYFGSGIEVTGGLAEGQVIVSAGGEKLSDNSKIIL